jgi:hypothetical protein
MFSQIAAREIIDSVYIHHLTLHIPMHIGAGIAHSVHQLATGWTTEGSEFESR